MNEVLSSTKAALAAAAAFTVALGLYLDQTFLSRLDYGKSSHQPWQVLDTSNFDWDTTKRPLRILFMTWGSRGDHQPNIALGLALAARGHDVWIMGLEKYEHLITKHKSINYVKLVDNHLWKLAEAFHGSEGVDFIAVTKEYVNNSGRELTQQYIKAAKDCQADVLVGSHSAMLMLHHVTVAQHLKLPLVFLTHDLTLPTADFSFNPSESRVLDYGRRTNLFNHRIFSLIFGFNMTAAPGGVGRVWRDYRKELGLSTPWPFWELLSPRELGDILVFSTHDTTLWKPPTDRPPHWYSTGFWVTRDANLPAISASDQALLDWIDAPNRRPILYLGQGSFDHHARSTFTDILLNTLEQLDMDAICLASTVDDRTNMPAHVRVVKEIDEQDLVFAKCAVVSHHGGAGTASQCIRGGTPGIGLPSMPFQNIWCAQLEEYGAGVNLDPVELLREWNETENNLLVPAVTRARQPAVQAKAKELAELAKSLPDGVTFSAEKLEAHVRKLVAQKAAGGAK